MSDVLKSFRDPSFMTPRGSQELARRLHEAAKSTKPVLKTGHMLTVLGHYAESEERAIARVREAQKTYQEGSTRRFAIVNSLGDVVGAATIYRDFPVSSVRAPLAPRFARGPLRRHHPEAGTNLLAWTGRVHGYELHRAYRALPEQCDDGEAVHALEPVDSQAFVHEALREAGLVPGEKARFDDGEAKRQIPPVSILYTGQVVVSDIAQILPRPTA